MSSQPMRGGSTGNGRERSGGRFRRALRRLSPAQQDRAGSDVRAGREDSITVPIADCADRERVELRGEIGTVGVSPDPDKPALEVELADGSGTVTLIWLGRRRIPGLEPGRRIRVSGRISCRDDGRRVIFNPRYDLD